MDSFALTEGIVPDSNNQDGHDAEKDSVGKLPEGANKFQRAIAAWRGIDLSNTIAKLDSTASDIVAQQRDALVQRKDLAQKTKDFRKLDDAAKLAEYKSLLKAYQSFIDVLTNQGKASSNAFLQLYSSLSEAPDPYPLLEASVDSLVHSEETVPKLTSERNQLQSNSIEFSAGDDDDARDLADDTTTAPNGTPSKDGAKNSLEQLLMSRNKKLTDELTILRVSHRDLQGQLETLREDLSATKEELEKSQKLSTTLENDLLRVQEEAANAFPSSAMSVAGTYTSRHPYSSRRGGTSPTSSIISGFDHSSGSSNTMDAIRAGEPVGGGSGLLPMIQAQRDRFKKKNAELEEELSKLYNTVKSLRQEVSSLQKDNLSLYEKTRYVSTYNRGQGGSSSASAYGNKPSASSVHLSADTPSGLSLDRYQSAYEAQISPFAAFKGRESVRAYKRMSLPERVVFSLTRIILANRTSRNLFAGYCFAIHILLFTMLYMMSTMEIEKHSASLGAAAAMAGGAGSSYDHQLDIAWSQ
ncbi:hypothetical protein APSETT445_009666 [Aspergillus pseudonomiae]